MIFTPRALLTYVVITTLIILMLKSTHPLDGMHFTYLQLPPTVTRLRVTIRSIWLLPDISCCDQQG